jgi:hypothetical protein
LKAEDGTFTNACMVNYLTNIRHLVCHGQRYIVRAGQRAVAVGDLRSTTSTNVERSSGTRSGQIATLSACRWYR